MARREHNAAFKVVVRRAGLSDKMAVRPSESPVSWSTTIAHFVNEHYAADSNLMCNPNAFAIFATVAKVGLPSSDRAL